MSVERSGQAIDVEILKGQLVTGGARGFNGGRQLSTDGTSRMNREVQVRICGGLGVKFPGPTRHWQTASNTGFHHMYHAKEAAAGCVRFESSLLNDLQRLAVPPTP